VRIAKFSQKKAHFVEIELEKQIYPQFSLKNKKLPLVKMWPPKKRRQFQLPIQIF
jgi:hypothetical protein